MAKVNELFNPKTIKRLCSSVKISTAQKKASAEWLKLLESGQLEKEKQNYFKFALIILKDLLGYQVKEEMGYEEGNVEFTFADQKGKKIICFEAKGTKTKDLFAPQFREKKEHSTPIKQTWDYMGTLNLDYGVATNYGQFVLIDKSKGTSKYHIFNFKDVKNNEDKLKEFIAIFSKESIIDKKFVVTLYDQSVIEEKEFTKQFYKLFHETRLMLIKEFQNNGDISKEDAIHYAQLFLNRMIFIFFAEDTGKIPQRLVRDQMLKVLDAVPVSEHSRYACDTIYSIFESLDKGASTPVQIFGFNGGLFQDKIPPRFFFKDLTESNFFKKEYQHSELKKKVKLDEFADKIIKKYKNRINPIVTNLLYMSSFDFNTELNVNILGHIFEQSLTDLEDLQENKTSKRKKEGIFYTPEYVTDFICRNAIIRFLSKKNVITSEELIKEHSDNIDELEEKFKKIKILDPACGSGAFLNQALEFLLAEHLWLDELLAEYHGASLVLSDIESQILENNLYGVDVNEESIEIAKLALWLRTAHKGRKLTSLSNHIKCGNSLIDDPEVAGEKAFNWKEDFTEVFSKGGFDVVIGNPPYVHLES
ncbi:MAG: N-6 DNA methylase, partial [Thaumarchaeota archaeon]|nr:N-6 DNA methylase [Nitrososphaerota archaeon]